MEPDRWFAFGPFRLGVADECLWKGKEEIRLTPKAFAVLKYLVEHAGRLVTKESLLENLWPGVYVTEGALTVCITEIRKALGDDSKKPTFIDTVHRRGYRFIAPVTTDQQPFSQTTLEEPTVASASRESEASITPPEIVRTTSSQPPLEEKNQMSFSAKMWGGALKGKGLRAKPWGRPALAIAAVLVVGVGMLAAWNYGRSPLVDETVTSKGSTALSGPEKPSIAVLAFDNMTGVPSQEYLSDGISDDIITRLARIPAMVVIARNSSFIYKNRPIKIQEIGRELSVRYVLEGSVRKAAERMRINVQLIEAATGKHLWAQSYDRGLTDIFAVQNDITQNVVKSVVVKLAFGKAAAITSIGTQNIDAWEAAIQGRWHFWQSTREDNAQARQLFQTALQLDPEFALMYVAIGQTHSQDGRRKYSKDPATSFKQAEEFLQKALAMDDSIAIAHCLQGHLYLEKGEHEKALAAIRRSAGLAPDDPFVLSSLARMLMKVGGSAEEAVETAEKAVRLHPRSELWIHRMLIRAYYYAGRYDQATTAAKKYLESDPKYVSIHTSLVASLAAAGRVGEAQGEARKILEQAPKFSARLQADDGFFREVPEPKVRERYFNHLRQAGLPE